MKGRFKQSFFKTREISTEWKAILGKKYLGHVLAACFSLFCALLMRYVRKLKEKIQNQDALPVAANWRGGQNGLFCPSILHVPFLNHQKTLSQSEGLPNFRNEL